MSSYKNNRKKKFLAQGGQVAVIIALLMVCLIGMTALVVDVGSLYKKRASFQTVADSAALAGAQELPDSSRAIDEAIYYAGENNVVIESGDVVISSTLAADDTIKVTPSDPAPVYFAGVLGINTVDIGASATAMVGEPEEVYYVVPWAAIVPEGTTNWWDELVPGTDKQIITYDKTSSKSDFCAWSVVDPLPGDWLDIYQARIISGYSSPLSVGDTIYVREIDMTETVGRTETRVTGDGGVWDLFGTLTYTTVDGVIKLAKIDTQFVIVPVIHKPKKMGDSATILAFAPFILLSIEGAGTPPDPYKIIGRFVDQALIVYDGEVKGVEPAGLRVIRLIR